MTKEGGDGRKRTEGKRWWKNSSICVCARDEYSFFLSLSLNIIIYMPFLQKSFLNNI